jgi:hypothetical protein
MPAIDLTRLKKQSGKLVEFFDQPEFFLIHLGEMLEYYTNRTFRASQLILEASLPTYFTPRPVLRQIERDLEKLSDHKPGAAVLLTTALWEASYYEACLLSAFLLGTIPLPSAMTLLTKLPQWLYETRSQDIKTALLTSSLARLRKENPQTLILLIKGWLMSPGPKTQTWGLHAFIPLIQQLGYNDLPQIFEILRPTIETISPSTQMDIQACILTLYSISPIETLHYLSAIFQGNTNPQAFRVFGRLLRGFPPEMQSNLRSILKNNPEPSRNTK